MVTKLYRGDCLKIMEMIPARSIDLILCDLPYECTAAYWDTAIPLKPLWWHYRRLLKPSGSVVLFCTQPFTSALVTSNPEWFKYCLVWEKTRATGHVHAKNAPMKRHEEIAVFSPASIAHVGLTDNRMTYNPQGLKKLAFPAIRAEKGKGSVIVLGSRPSHKATQSNYTNYPDSILRFDSEHNGNGAHPTQKPQELLKYLIKTFSNEGAMVLDNTMGSGGTICASAVTGRSSIGIEKDAKFFDVAVERVKSVDTYMTYMV